MLNVYLFIELLSGTDPAAVLAEIRFLNVANGKLRNVVQLSDDKLVAHLDFETGDDASRVIVEEFMRIDGIVQTNLIAAVRPRDG